MRDVFVVVEGQTEEAFVNAVIQPHLAAVGAWATPIVVCTSRERSGRKKKGGGDWTKWASDIRGLCRDGRPEIRITTLFDLYRLPKNFPGLEKHSQISDTLKRCDLLEAEMSQAIGDQRFIPYLQRHEFEALVLAGLEALHMFLGDPADRAGLARLEEDIRGLSPEDINDGDDTAPSKRLERFIPSYQSQSRRRSGAGKPFYGELVTDRTGLPVLREKCPRFGEWIAKLESLGG